MSTMEVKATQVGLLDEINEIYRSRLQAVPKPSIVPSIPSTSFSLPEAIKTNHSDIDKQTLYLDGLCDSFGWAIVFSLTAIAAICVIIDCLLKLHRREHESAEYNGRHHVRSPIKGENIFSPTTPKMPEFSAIPEPKESSDDPRFDRSLEIEDPVQKNIFGTPLKLHRDWNHSIPDNSPYDSTAPSRSNQRPFREIPLPEPEEEEPRPNFLQRLWAATFGVICFLIELFILLPSALIYLSLKKHVIPAVVAAFSFLALRVTLLHESEFLNVARMWIRVLRTPFTDIRPWLVAALVAFIGYHGLGFSGPNGRTSIASLVFGPPEPAVWSLPATVVPMPSVYNQWGSMGSRSSSAEAKSRTAEAAEKSQEAQGVVGVPVSQWHEQEKAKSTSNPDEKVAVMKGTPIGSVVNTQTISAVPNKVNVLPESRTRPQPMNSRLASMLENKCYLTATGIAEFLEEQQLQDMRDLSLIHI